MIENAQGRNEMNAEPVQIEKSMRSKDQGSFEDDGSAVGDRGRIM